MTLVLSILRQIGLAGCILIGAFLYYEGIPGLNRFPILGAIPLIGDLAVGRVAIVRDQAVKDATAELVSRAELKAAQARADELQRQAKRNAEAALAAHKQAEIATANADAARAELERKIADEADPRASRWTGFDLERLQHAKK